MTTFYWVVFIVFIAFLCLLESTRRVVMWVFHMKDHLQD